MKEAHMAINGFETRLWGTIVVRHSNKCDIFWYLNYLLLSAAVYLELWQHFI